MQQNAHMQQQQQFSSAVRRFICLFLFMLCPHRFAQPVMQPTFDFVEDAMMKKKREASK
jgi:hypothetical protein